MRQIGKSAKQPIGILLIDDHPVYREGMKAIIRGDARYAVVGEAESGQEALRLAETLKPDVALLDLVLREEDGVDLIKALKEKRPLRVIILSGVTKIASVQRCFDCGADGFVNKESSFDCIFEALGVVLDGRKFLDSSISFRMLGELKTSKEAKVVRIEDNLAILTQREREVLTMVAKGLSLPDIGKALGISPRTAETHRTNAMRKLKCRNAVELVRYALRNGLLEPDSGS